MNWEKTHKFDCSMGDHENQFYISCSGFSPIISCFNTLTLKNVHLTQDSTHQNLEIGLAVAGVAPHVGQNPFFCTERIIFLKIIEAKMSLIPLKQFNISSVN